MTFEVVQITCDPTLSAESKAERKSREKEQRRVQRIRDWHDRVKKNADEWLEQQIVKIKADAEANAWRPQVSSKVFNDYEICFHTLFRYGPDDGNSWRTYRNRYIAGWCGLTVTNLSDFEVSLIKKQLRTIGYKNYLAEKSELFEDKTTEIGVFEDYCLNYWFKNLEDHNSFVAALESFPKRNRRMILQDSADIEAIKKLLEGKNYRIFEGEYGTLLSYGEGVSDALELMIKMHSV